MAGAGMVDIMKNYLPMDGIAMKTLFTVGSLLPAVGVAILLKQVVKKPLDFHYPSCLALPWPPA